MARSDTVTLLPLDTYAKIMGINPCAFNQVYNPLEAYPTECNEVWLQSANVGAANRLVGRDEVAEAIAIAEEMIAEALGFWPAPHWQIADEQAWPYPRRGCQVTYPPVGTRWGMVIAGGQENTNTVISLCQPVVYTDEDGDGIDDTATITITAAQLAAAGAVWDEIALYYPSVYLDWSPRPRNEQWRIRARTVQRHPTTGNVTIQVHRCQLVLPDLWEDDAPIDQSIDANFLTCVDVYRRYNDASAQAQIVYKSAGNLCTTAPCSEVCQSACFVIDDARNGLVRIIPATYSAGVWTLTSFTNGAAPDAVRMWYQAGYWHNLAGWMEADRMTSSIAEAIARLANTYLPEAPCDCQKTQRRWLRDREEQKIDNVDTALAMSAFGTTMRGAVFAWSAIKRLNPLQGAGAL